MIARLALAALLWSTTALAEEPQGELIAHDAQGNVVSVDDRAGFGVPGQWVISTDAELSFRRTTLTHQEGAQTSLSIAPGVDYFIIPNLSLGGGFGIFYTKAGKQNATTFNIGPRVGYNFELSRLLSVWPKVGFSFSHANQDTARGQANALAINLFAPILLHPVQHMFAGFGPFVDADLTGKTRSTSYGLKLSLGGWLNGKRAETHEGPP